MGRTCARALAPSGVAPTGRASRMTSGLVRCAPTGDAFPSPARVVRQHFETASITSVHTHMNDELAHPAALRHPRKEVRLQREAAPVPVRVRVPKARRLDDPTELGPAVHRAQRDAARNEGVADGLRKGPAGIFLVAEMSWRGVTRSQGTYEHEQGLEVFDCFVVF